MKKGVIIFLIGVIFGSGGYWTFRDGPLATKLRESKLVQKISDAFDERATDKLKDEMAKTGKITASQSADSKAITVEDGKLKDLVKAMLSVDPTVSDADIKVDVENDQVSLRGSATSWDQVGHAIKLALDCPGTRTVISTIEVKAK